MYVPTVSVSTEPVVTTVMSPERSVAVAPASVYVSPNSELTVASPATVSTGAVVSTTFTVLVAVDSLPDESVAMYVSTYVPTSSSSTVPVVITLIVPERSVAVAPASM